MNRGKSILPGLLAQALQGPRQPAPEPLIIVDELAIYGGARACGKTDSLRRFTLMDPVPDEPLKPTTSPLLLALLRRLP